MTKTHFLASNDLTPKGCNKCIHNELQLVRIVHTNAPTILKVAHNKCAGDFPTNLLGAIRCKNGALIALCRNEDHWLVRMNRSFSPDPWSREDFFLLEIQELEPDEDISCWRVGTHEGLDRLIAELVHKFRGVDSKSISLVELKKSNLLKLNDIAPTE